MTIPPSSTNVSQCVRRTIQWWRLTRDGAVMSLSILSAMRAATLSLLVLVASCRSQNAAVTTHAAVPDSDTVADQAEALDELNSTTEGIVSTLKQHKIMLLPTNSDTIYVALPNRQRRLILLDGLDYPFGYVLIEPGTAERILAGLY